MNGLNPAENLEQIHYLLKPGDPGHVGYVEGVTDDGIWISDAGSGITWRGVHFYPFDSGNYQAIAGFIYLDMPL